jgi:hypothetical protein
MNKKINLLLLISAIVFFVACKKEEGIGGKAVIKGKVYQQNYDNGGNLVSGFNAPEVRVYISYGMTEYYDDDKRTGADGNYEFEFLRPGKYTVFVYSQQSPLCGICPEIAIKKEVTIDGKKDVVQLENLIIDRY